MTIDSSQSDDVLDFSIPRVLLGSKRLPLNQAHVRNVMHALFGSRETPDLSRATFSMLGSHEDQPLLRDQDEDSLRRMVWECPSGISATSISTNVHIQDIQGQRYEYVYQHDSIEAGYEALIRDRLLPAPRLPWRFRSGAFEFQSESPRSLMELFTLACYEPRRLQVIEECAQRIHGLMNPDLPSIEALAWDPLHPTADTVRMKYTWSLSANLYGLTEQESQDRLSNLALLRTLRNSAADINRYERQNREGNTGVVRLFTPACWRPWRTIDELWRTAQAETHVRDWQRLLAENSKAP